MGMAQIFTDFPAESKPKSLKWQKPHAICLLPASKSVNI